MSVPRRICALIALSLVLGLAVVSGALRSNATVASLFSTSVLDNSALRSSLTKQRTALRNFIREVALELNSPPVANADSYNVHGYKFVPGNSVLTNDTDPDGDTLSLANCSVTITWKDQTKWTFNRMPSSSTYSLNQITNRTGQSVNLTWNSSRAPIQIADAATSAVLITFTYGSDGKLSNVTDTYGRKVAYTFSSAGPTSFRLLQSVSQVVTSGTSNPPARWSYGYAVDKGLQLSTALPQK